MEERLEDVLELVREVVRNNYMYSLVIYVSSILS